MTQTFTHSWTEGGYREVKYAEGYIIIPPLVIEINFVMFLN